MQDLEQLNEKYRALSAQERIRALSGDFPRVLFTSSFGTTSAVLLHLFREALPGLPVYFLDTTYHFAETLEYKATLTQRLGLTVIDVKPEEWKNKFTREDHTWHKDPDLCCSINKVEPLDRMLPQFDVWVSGLMRTQNNYRDALRIFEPREGYVKFFPILDWTEADAKAYIEKHQLPPHPLMAHGYNSVGCFHCTTKGKGREGRWANKSKTECGLHL